VSCGFKLSRSGISDMSDMSTGGALSCLRTQRQGFVSCCRPRFSSRLQCSFDSCQEQKTHRRHGQMWDEFVLMIQNDSPGFFIYTTALRVLYYYLYMRPHMFICLTCGREQFTLNIFVWARLKSRCCVWRVDAERSRSEKQSPWQAAPQRRATLNRKWSFVIRM